MKVGFTGTQQGMTDEQHDKLLRVLEILNRFAKEPMELHHGDCIGADAEAVNVAKAYCMALIVCHPPTDHRKRAYVQSDKYCDEQSYLVRNRNIVDSTKLLLATPRLHVEELRSGTWATIRYAKTTGKPIMIIWPDGTTERR